MPTTPNKSDAEQAATKPTDTKPPDIAAASVSDTLAVLHVNPETGLTSTEIDARRKEHGYNEVAEQKEHPVSDFLRKFWGISAWMLELIMVLSAVLGKYTDLAVVSALLIVNAVLSFSADRRAQAVAGDAEAGRPTGHARASSDANWQIIRPGSWFPATFPV